MFNLINRARAGGTMLLALIILAVAFVLLTVALNSRTVRQDSDVAKSVPTMVPMSVAKVQFTQLDNRWGRSCSPADRYICSPSSFTSVTLTKVLPSGYFDDHPYEVPSKDLHEDTGA